MYSWKWEFAERMEKRVFVKGLNTRENMAFNDAIQKELVDSLQERMNKLCNIACLTHDNCVHNTKRDFLEVYRLKEELILTYDNEWNFVERDGEQPDCSNFKRKYQFLIEFCTDNPTVGIYCGCRVQINFKENLSDTIRDIQEEWNCKTGKKGAFNMQKRFLQLLDLRKIPPYYKCLERTDNANEYTYWPFWIRIHEGEDLNLYAVKVICILKDVYNMRFVSKAYDSQVEPFSIKALQRLLGDNNHIKAFQEHMENMEKLSVFERNKKNECAWKYIHSKNPFHVYIDKQDFAKCKELIMANRAHWPWEDLCRVFQKKDGSHMSASTLKVEYSKSKKKKV